LGKCQYINTPVFDRVWDILGVEVHRDDVGKVYLSLDSHSLLHIASIESLEKLAWEACKYALGEELATSAFQAAKAKPMSLFPVQVPLFPKPYTKYGDSKTRVTSIGGIQVCAKKGEVVRPFERISLATLLAICEWAKDSIVVEHPYALLKLAERKKTEWRADEILAVSCSEYYKKRRNIRRLLKSKRHAQFVA
jgi:hypothetical protein